MHKFLISVSVAACVESPSYADAVDDVAETIRRVFSQNSAASEVVITEIRARLQTQKTEEQQ